MQKVPQGGVSEHLDHNGMNTEQASKRARYGCQGTTSQHGKPSAVGRGTSCGRRACDFKAKAEGWREARNASNVWCHQLEIREDQSRPRGVTERSVIARKRVTIVERRDLSSRATLEAARAGRLT